MGTLAPVAGRAASSFPLRRIVPAPGTSSRDCCRLPKIGVDLNRFSVRENRVGGPSQAAEFVGQIVVGRATAKLSPMRWAYSIAQRVLLRGLLGPIQLGVDLAQLLAASE